MTGGGKYLKNRTKSLSYTSKFVKNLKLLSENLKNLYKNAERFLTPRREEESSKGAILIEFAVCMPVLIILLFYINDLVRIKRYYSQTEFIAQQIANMLQNVSQKRATEATTSTERKRQLRITTNDTWRIARLAFLTVYPGLTQLSPFSLNHYPAVFIYYVKNNKDGTASCKWRNFYWGDYNNYSGCSTSAPNQSSITYKSNVIPSEIHPNLKFNSEDAKIIVEVFLSYRGDNKTFGLRFVTPRAKVQSCFHSVVIFTPKPGLFYESLMAASYASYSESQVASW